MLVVLADEETVARRSFANLPNAHTTSFGELSAHDVLRSDWILFSDRTLPGSGPADFSTGLAEVEGAADTSRAGRRLGPRPADRHDRGGRHRCVMPCQC